MSSLLYQREIIVTLQVSQTIEHWTVRQILNFSL